VFLYQVWFKFSLPVVRCVQFKLTIFCAQDLAGITIATIVRLRLLVPVISKIFIKFSIQRCLDNNLRQRLAKFNQILLGSFARYLYPLQMFDSDAE
jgi:hypothetical protein